jgi:hypothetical protein
LEPSNLEKEKWALEWIQENLLSPKGEYHSLLEKLEAPVINHLNARLKALLSES